MHVPLLRALDPYARGHAVARKEKPKARSSRLSSSLPSWTSLKSVGVFQMTGARRPRRATTNPKRTMRRKSTNRRKSRTRTRRFSAGTNALPMTTRPCRRTPTMRKTSARCWGGPRAHGTDPGIHELRIHELRIHGSSCLFHYARLRFQSRASADRLDVARPQYPRFANFWSEPEAEPSAKILSALT